MIAISATAEFAAWLDGLRDGKAKQKIDVRIFRASQGNLGDVKFFNGIGEMRIDFVPGYRIYFVRRRQEAIIMLCGGDKSTQDRDIKRALDMATEI
jgi:putative addiction module killer protein